MGVGFWRGEHPTFAYLEVFVRELTSHRVNGLNEAVYIGVMDDPGASNACHEYDLAPLVVVPLTDEESSEGVTRHRVPVESAHVVIRFQNGPIAEVGVNGVSNESLLAIVEDRLLGFQSGQFACRENAIALTKIQEAMMWLAKRTRDRMARGVEGRNVI